jgi:hypothetical protein
MVGTILVFVVFGLWVLEKALRDVVREMQRTNKYLRYLSWMTHRERAKETGESWSDPGA